MNQLVRCPAGTLYDAAVQGQCPCPNCWADRSFLKLATSKNSGAVGPNSDVRIALHVPAAEAPNAPAAKATATVSETAIPGPTRFRIPRWRFKQGPLFNAVYRYWFSFSGRATRGEFWTLILIDYVALLATTTIWDSTIPAFLAFGIVLAVSLAISMLAISSRRLHDRDLSAWWMFLTLGTLGLLISLPVVGFATGQLAFASSPFVILPFAAALIGWAFIEAGCVLGTTGENRFGPDPLGGRTRSRSKGGFLHLWFSFDGRVNRAKFWLVFLTDKLFLVGAILLIVAVVSGLFPATFRAPRSSTGVQSYIIGISVIAIVFPYLASVLAISIKRLRDLDANPSWVALIFLLWAATAAMPVLKGVSVIVQALAILVLGSFAGTVGFNRYGPDPIARDTLERLPDVSTSGFEETSTTSFPKQTNAILIIARDAAAADHPSTAGSQLRAGTLFKIATTAVAGIALLGAVILLAPRDAKLAVDILLASNADDNQCFRDKDIPACNRVIAAHPKTTQAYMARGLAYYNKGEYDRAIADYDQAIQLVPNYALAFNERGSAYFLKRDFDRAIGDYDQSIRLNPADGIVLLNRGSVYFSKADYDRAIADYSQSIQLNPKNARALLNRSNAYRKKGDTLRADSDCREALQLDPKTTCSVAAR
jgi:uncharacterized membrane protein YhaH (DUF805 family)/cytochrome c-type biogenesis protein CcmH/NrfG